MNDIIKSFVIFLSGFLTIGLAFVSPDPGGGMAIVFIYTVPFLIGIGFLLSLVYYFYSQKINKEKTKDTMLYWMVFILVLLSFILFPYNI